MTYSNVPEAPDRAWSDSFLVHVDDARGRRPIDAVTAVVGGLLVLFTALKADQLTWLESLIGDIIAQFPEWLDTTFVIVYLVGLLYAVFIVVLVISQGRMRLSLLRDLGLVFLLAAGLATVLTQIVSNAWPVFLPEVFDQVDPLYPVVRVATVTAIVIVAGPHLVRPMRRFGWLMVFLIALAALDLGYGLTTDVLGGIGIGLLSAGIVLVVFGSPRGYPSPADVTRALSMLGVDVIDLTVADVQTWGARQFAGVGDDAAPLSVRVYGRDARDAQLITRWWRSIWYRDTGPNLTTSRLHQVEHEALLTIAAAEVDVPAQQVLAAGDPTDHDAVLALSARGAPLPNVDDAAVTDDVMIAMWASTAKLHKAGIAHGRLNAGSFRLDQNGPVLENFRTASMGAHEARIHCDTGELLASLSSRFGAERAVAAALQGLGEDAVVAALPYVQPSAVSTEGRSDLTHERKLFSGIRDEIGAQTGVEVPKVAQLRRVSIRSLGMFALTLLAAYALIGMVSGIDLRAVGEELQDADWAWIFVAFVITQFTLFFDAMSMMAATAQPIPMKPTVQLESAIKFIQLAIGGAAGRLATNIAYLRKFGVGATDAVTQGGVDSLTGFFIQAFIILGAILFGDIDLVPDDASADINWALVLTLLGFAIVVSVLMVRFVPAIRKHVVPPLSQMWDGLATLAKSPGRLIRLLSANLISQLLFAFGLWLTALAFGWVLPFLSVLLVNTIASLLAGLLPIPGGVGVTEAMLTAGLVALGVDESAAFAIAVVFRVCSSYLPPVWGWFSLKWLQKNDYL